MADITREEQEHLIEGIYDEDVVQTKDGKKLGVVLKTARLDYESESTDSEEEDDEKLEQGKLLVAWYSTQSRKSNDEEPVDEKTVKLIDRSILPGDVVRWVDKSKGRQKAQVVDVNVLANIRVVGTNFIIKDVDARELCPLNKFNEGETVVLDSWVGVIQHVNLELTLRLKNGSRCIIKGDAADNLTDITDMRDEDSTFYCDQFYPGQQVHSIARTFKDAQWITGSRPAVGNHGRLKAVIEDASLQSLTVDWQICGYTGDCHSATTAQPNQVLDRTLINSGKLKAIGDIDKESRLQIGDKAYYVLKDKDVEEYNKTSGEVKKDKKDPTEENEEDEDENDEETDEEGEGVDSTRPKPANTTHRRSGTGRVRRKRHLHLPKKRKKYQPPVTIVAGATVCVEVCYTKTSASIIWQNATEMDNVPSTELCPVIHLNELEFFPGDFVVDKRGGLSQNDRFGVVQASDFEGRLVDVCWLTYTNSTTETIKDVENDVSVYDVEDHQDYTFRIGDDIIRLANQTHNDEVPDGTDRLAPAGLIVKVNNDGSIHVRWVDETSSNVLPSQVFLFQIDGNEEFDFEDHSESDENEWETEESDGSDVQEDLQQHLNPLEDIITRSLAALGHTGGNDSNNTDNEENSILNMNQRTSEFISALEHRFGNVGQLQRFETTSSSDNAEPCSTPSGDSLECSKEACGATEETHEEDECNDAGTETQKKLDSFSTVEAVPECHKFYSVPTMVANQKTFNTAVMKDLKLLKSHLPDGILVRAFDNRMDVFSVLITGSQGTPYEDGLFYFDLQLPYNYPVSPPVVYYHSYCASRLNPNLYEDGKVCVSLLGTWTGKGSEMWTSKSTLHQLLVSIQSLILCEEPYYNEAGYENHRGSTEGSENSRMYNEMAIIKTLQSMERMADRPPEIFKKEVEEHFKKALPKLLHRFESLLSNDQLDVPPYPLLPISKGFRASVTKVLVELKKRATGAPCSAGT